MVHELPKWSQVKFEDMMRVTWLNIMLEKLWPYVDRAVKTTVKEYLEPLMNEDDYRPTSVSNVTFTSFTMGTLPPKIRGVKVRSICAIEDGPLVPHVLHSSSLNVPVDVPPPQTTGVRIGAAIG